MVKTTSASSRQAQIDQRENTPEWYVVYTKPGAEDIAKDQLEKKNVEVFLPKVSEHDYFSKREEVKTKPLFPNYLFAKLAFPNDYYKVIWAKGVKRIIGNGEAPVPLDESVVDFFVKQSNDSGIIQLSTRLRIRDKVMVKNGPFEGLVGIVDCSQDRNGRIRVLMDFLKEGACIEIPHTAVERL